MKAIAKTILPLALGTTLMAGCANFEQERPVTCGLYEVVADTLRGEVEIYDPESGARRSSTECTVVGYFMNDFAVDSEGRKRPTEIHIRIKNGHPLEEYADSRLLTEVFDYYKRIARRGFEDNDLGI